MSPTSPVYKNVLIIVLVLAVVSFVAYSTYSFFHGSAWRHVVVPSSEVEGDPVPEESVVVDEFPSEDSFCDSVPLAIVRDSAFKGSSVRHGESRQTIGRFKLMNTTACPVAIASLLFLTDSTSDQRFFDTAYLMANNEQFGPDLSIGETEGTIGFFSKYSSLVVPAFGQVHLSVLADMSVFAPVGKSFAIQLHSLVGKNEKTGEAYFWSYDDTRMRVVSNEIQVR